MKMKMSALHSIRRQWHTGHSNGKHKQEKEEKEKEEEGKKIIQLTGATSIRRLYYMKSVYAVLH